MLTSEKAERKVSPSLSWYFSRMTGSAMNASVISRLISSTVLAMSIVGVVEKARFLSAMVSFGFGHSQIGVEHLLL